MGEHGDPASRGAAALTPTSLCAGCSGLKLFEPFWLVRAAAPPSRCSEDPPCSDPHAAAAGSTPCCGMDSSGMCFVASLHTWCRAREYERAAPRRNWGGAGAMYMLRVLRFVYQSTASTS